MPRDIPARAWLHRSQPPLDALEVARRVQRPRGERALELREELEQVPAQPVLHEGALAHQRVMAARHRQTIEELTGRKVLAFLSQAHGEPDITMEIFVVDAPLEGLGAVEITEPG